MRRAGRASRVFAGLPPHGARQRIGLYGGTFNPAHLGHRHVSLLALKRLGLDQLWWLVTPGNPLKDVRALPPLKERMRRAAEVASHPRIAITGVERALRTRYTADLLKDLRRRTPKARFVWVMGSDNLAQFHLWERWREIAASAPIAVVNRPAALAAMLSSPAAQALAPYRVDEADARTLADRSPPAWTFLIGPRTSLSSTVLRATSAAS